MMLTQIFNISNFVRISTPGKYWLTVAMAVLLAAGCNPTTGDQTRPGGLAEGTVTMQPAQAVETTTALIPPIDAAAPPHTETATFALG